MNWKVSIVVSSNGLEEKTSFTKALAAGGLLGFRAVLKKTVPPALSPAEASPAEGAAAPSKDAAKTPEPTPNEPTIEATLALSPAIIELLGLNEEFLAKEAGDFLTELIHPQDQEDMLNKVLACLNGAPEFDADHLIFSPALGAWREAQTFAGQTFRDDERLEFTGFFRLNRENSALAKFIAGSGDYSSQSYKLMLDNMTEVCSLWDTSFNHLDSNEAVVPLFGLPNKKAFTEYFPSLSPPYQPDGSVSEDSFKDHLRKTFAEGRDQFEWLFQTLDGDPIQADINQVKVATPQGDILVSFIRDITSLKATEAEVERERSLLQKILDNSPIAFLVSVGGLVRFFSPFARQSLGLTIDAPLPKLFVNAEQFNSLVKNLERKGRVAWQETLIYNGEGNERHMLLNAFKTEYYGDIGYLFWLMDITEMVEKEKALSLAREEAEASTKAKSEFLANMSHEIRTPMNAIIGLSHLALQTELDKQPRDYISRVLKAAKTLLRIINDILDFSKIEAGKLEMERVEFNLAELVSETMELQALKASEKNLEFYVDIPERLPPTIIGDQVRLAQILTNLVSNAIKFTAEGEVGVKMEIVGDEIPQVLTLRFTIRDSGIGMTQEEINRLFTPFSQADTSTTRRYGGTGLGLTITKRLVEMMNGQIWCNSVPKHGSAFIFTARFGLTEAWSQETAPKPYLGREALAIDDNPSALQIISTNLTSMGFNVSRASSGESAVNRVKASRLKGEMVIPDVILVDYKMHKLDGLETIRQLRDEYSPAKPMTLLMVAGLAPDSVQNEAKEMDIATILSKPVSLFNLQTSLSGLLVKKIAPAPVPVKPPTKLDPNALLSGFKGRPILLVEDNEVNQLVASKILRKAGLEVTIANNGLEALKKVQEDHYDLVLMDIQMPEMDGLTATKEIRKIERFKELPIVAMTAHAMTGDRDLSLASGMNDHVTKPIDIPELFKTLAKWLPREAAQPEEKELKDNLALSPANSATEISESK
ncbi:MAG: response regulator [Deltaproteobacteria bacterium]|jgi:signal transduction histidine kinase/DNA-binding response OmpR family regulator|nr:response regulator [Deltaproteobacteria bacterium]